MLSLGFEVATQCRACGNLLALNALVSVVACPTCLRRFELPEARWSMLVGHAIAPGASAAPQTEQSGAFETEEGTYRRSWRRCEPACSRCQTPIDEAAIRSAWARGSGRCASCSQPFAVRPPPAWLAQLGVTALVGEDGDQLAGPDASAQQEPVPLSCSRCGGNLRVDGRSRLVHCQFCNQDQYLPDELWRHFHPAKPLARWYALLGAERAAAPVPSGATPGLARWDELGDAVMDPMGNIYCVGSYPAGAGEEPAVWSMTADLRLRWLRSGLSLEPSESGLALFPSGHLLLWSQGKRVSLVLSAQDGSTVAKLSGQPGELGALETNEVENLLVDADGTILLVASGERLLRYGPQGQAVATWGQGPREPRPDEDEDSHVVSRMGERPLFCMAARLGTSVDGTLLVQGVYSTNPTIELAKYERSGRRLWFAELQTGRESWAGGRPGTDGWGNIYLFTRLDNELPCVWRVDPRGGRGQGWLAHRSLGGALGAEDKMLVARNAAVWMLGPGGMARGFGPDGRVCFISEASRASDAQGRRAGDIE